MTDWTNTRLNLRYHWKAALLWVLGIGSLLVFACWPGQTSAWVKGYQPFPGGNATVVMHRFCRSQDCGPLSDQEWQALIQSALNEWNNAGSNFRFQPRARRLLDRPCASIDPVVVVIFADPDQVCPGDGPLRYAGRTEYGNQRARVYINAQRESMTDPNEIRRMLLHEFGHVVGLGHPNEHGWYEHAIMNSNLSTGTLRHQHLQEDDIAGIRALYGHAEPDPDPDYCVYNDCGAGEGDCDPGQCAAGLICVNDVGAQYGLPAHYDVCEVRGSQPDPDYCVNNSCGLGDGDCDPGQCDEGVCINDVGAQYGLPAHYDVCEIPSAGKARPDPDYCVHNACGIGDGDCDPGQCDEGVCVADVGAQYGLPAYYDVCEATGGPQPDPDYCVNHTCGIGDGDCDPGQCDEGSCVADVGANYGLPAYYDVCEATSPPPPDFGRLSGRWTFDAPIGTFTWRIHTIEETYAYGNSDRPGFSEPTEFVSIRYPGQSDPSSTADYDYLASWRDSSSCYQYAFSFTGTDTTAGVAWRQRRSGSSCPNAFSGSRYAVSAYR